MNIYDYKKVTKLTLGHLYQILNDISEALRYEKGKAFYTDDFDWYCHVVHGVGPWSGKAEKIIVPDEEARYWQAIALRDFATAEEYGLVPEEYAMHG